MMSNQPDLARRQRQATHILVLILRQHADLPVLTTWTIAPDGLHAHIDLCDVDADHDRRVFTTWVTALDLTRHPEPVSETTGTVHLHAHRHINGLLVTLTATVHPF
jgi:hypothetical protein